MMGLTLTHRYAAIVTGFDLVTPGIGWRRLSSDTRPILGLNARTPEDSRPRLLDNIALHLSAELPINIDLHAEIPALLLPSHPAWRGGPLQDHEFDLVFDTGHQPRTSGDLMTSTAIDAIGARLLMRIFSDGHVEIIPIAYADGGAITRASSFNRPLGGLSASFLFLKPIAIVANGTGPAIHIDMGRLIDPSQLPLDPAELAAHAAKLFWDEINPRRGHPFQSMGGIMIDAGGSERDVEAAIRISKMALRAEIDARDCVIYVEIPIDDCGLARVNGVSCRSPGAPGARHVDGLPGLKAEILAAAAFALCDRWETHTVLPVHSDPFGIDPAGAKTHRSLRIALDPHEIEASGHEAIKEFGALSDFWCAHRRNTRVINALATYPETMVAALDRFYGSDT